MRDPEDPASLWSSPNLSFPTSVLHISTVSSALVNHWAEFPTHYDGSSLVESPWVAHCLLYSHCLAKLVVSGSRGSLAYFLDSAWRMKHLLLS